MFCQRQVVPIPIYANPWRTNRGDGREKETLVNIRETREFVINSVSVEQGRQMFGTAESLPHGMAILEM
jgi:hypothetical protein